MNLREDFFIRFIQYQYSHKPVKKKVRIKFQDDFLDKSGIYYCKPESVDFWSGKLSKCQTCGLLTSCHRLFGHRDGPWLLVEEYENLRADYPEYFI